MAEERFKVIFTGKIRTDRESFRQNLKDLYQLDEERLRRFFTGRPVVLTRNAVFEKAQKYNQVFDRIGGVCVIRSESEEVTQNLANSMPVAAQSAHKPERFVFRGGRWGLLGFTLLLNLLSSFFLTIPIGLHVWLSWMGENTSLASGKRLRYTGTLGQAYLGLAKIILLVVPPLVVIQLAGAFLMSPRPSPAMVAGLGVATFLVMIVLTFYVYLRITRWVVQSFAVQDYGSFIFTGTLPEYVKWMLLNVLPVFIAMGLVAAGAPLMGGRPLIPVPPQLVLLVFFPIYFLIYTPWWVAGFWGWLVSRTRTESLHSLSWNGASPYKVLIPAFILSMLVIPVPWMLHKVVRWLVDGIQLKQG